MRHPAIVARPHSLGLAIAFATAACGASPDPEGPVAESRDAIVVCPGGPTVPGIDVSEWQGGIDWPAVAGSGIGFAIARISDGTYLDDYFAGNWAQMKANGLVRGAYQFYEPNVDPVTQANIVIGAVGQLGPGDLPVTLDVEWTSGTPNGGAIQTWVDLVTQGTGKRPMIYTALGYWNQYFNGEFGYIDLWVANWSVDCPSLPSSWSGWLFWQTGGGPVPGIGGNVDQDVFNGNIDDLHMLADADATQNCAASHAGACAHFGCHCVDDQCSGGFCPGTGCTAQHTTDCGNYGCGCVDGQCAGAFCPGTGCTAKETLDCQAQGMDCSMYQCVPIATGAGGGGDGGHPGETSGAGDTSAGVGAGDPGDGGRSGIGSTSSGDLGGASGEAPAEAGDDGGCQTSPGGAGSAASMGAGLLAWLAAMRRRRSKLSSLRVPSPG